MSNGQNLNYFFLIFLSLSFGQCGKPGDTEKNTIVDSVEKVKPTVNEPETELVGIDFFKSILDTIQIHELKTETLLDTKWNSEPLINCISTYLFFEDAKGDHYDCELEDSKKIIYKIQNDTLIIEEYDIPQVDNPDQKTIMTRVDKFVYNGIALTMIGSTMYNLAGKRWTPSIKTVIEYLPE
jgi:hypothetical protein